MPRPRSNTIHQYRLRIDAQTDEKIIQFCKEHTTRYQIAHHTVVTNDNPHHHLYVETHFTQGNLSNTIKKYFGVSKDQYCNQTCDPDRVLEYYSYLYNTKKGNVPRYVASEGFSAIDIATYKANAVQVEKDFQTMIREKKKTQFDIVQVVLDRIPNHQFVCPSTIYDVLISVLKETRTVARPNHVKDMISSVMAFSSNVDANNKAKDLTLKYFLS